MTIGFEAGVPVSVDGKRLKPVRLLETLNAVAGKTGVVTDGVKFGTAFHLTVHLGGPAGNRNVKAALGAVTGTGIAESFSFLSVRVS